MSHRTSRIINAANGSAIVGYARAENGAGGRQHKGSWSIGRFRSGLPEGVCEKALAAPGPGDGADTVECSECGVAEVYRSGSWHNLLFRTRPANARTAVPLSAVEGEAKNVSRRVPLATNPLCRKANNASAPHCGKKAMTVTILLAVENGARSLCLKALCTREVSDNSDSR